jgi:hypothetical protein
MNVYHRAAISCSSVSMPPAIIPYHGFAKWQEKGRRHVKTAISLATGVDGVIGAAIKRHIHKHHTTLIRGL